MLLFPSTNHSDVLQQFKAVCTLGILIGDIMMRRGGKTGEAACIKPVKSSDCVS